MKKKIIYYLLIAAFPVCIAMIIAGAYLENNVLWYLGVGILFGGSFLLVIVIIVVMFVRARKKADKIDRNENSDAGSENEPYAGNRYSATEDEIAFSIHGFRHLSAKYKLICILFLTATLGSVFVGILLLFLKQLIAAYVCFGCFAAILFIGILFAVIPHRGASRSKNRKQSPVYQEATVLRCDAFSSSYSYAANNDETPTVTYRIVLEIDGKKCETRDTKSFQAGEKVSVFFQDGWTVIRR